MEDQYNVLLEQISRKKADIKAREAETEEAYKNGKISQAEYLSLKNQLKQEFDNYASSASQRSNEIRQQMHERIRRQYEY